MSFNSLLTHRINTWRIKASGVGIQKAFMAELTGQPCMIQPLSAEYAAKVNEVFGRAYNLFLPIDADVVIGDKLVDQDGYEYRVTGSQTRNYGNNPHKTLIISQQVQANPDK